MHIGDKFVATKNVLGFLSEGDNVVVTDINDNYIYFIFSKDSFEGKGHITTNEFNEYFKKVEEEKTVINTVSEFVPYEFVEELMAESEIETMTVGNCTIVTCTLPNGFVIVESSACANSEDYDEEIGADICLDKIADKIWQFETYRTMYEAYINSLDDECDCENCCSTDCPDHPNYGEFFH